MASSFSWLDFSESDRQQTMQILDLFREKNTLDELGFAPIRDAFADHFFPGTSTIQTRARYFLFVPWIMQRYENKGLLVPEFLNRVRSDETKLIRALLDGDSNQSGIIGREAKGTLKRMPSAVYWRGLKLWGIRLFDGSIDQYARQILRRRQQARHSLITDDGEPVQGQRPLWAPGLPPEPDGLLESVTFELSEVESRFLIEHICSMQPRSVLAQLLMEAAAPGDSEWIWDNQLQPLLTPQTRMVVEAARRFAMCAWGGSLIYTRLVAILKGGCEQLIDAVDIRLQVWQQQLELEASALHAWDLHEFWSLVREITPRLSEQTRQFSDEWIAVSRQVAAGKSVWQEARVEALLRNRESRLKGLRARLCRENLRARDRWQGSVTNAPMDYRWSQTRTILNDILKALAASQSPPESLTGDVSA